MDGTVMGVDVGGTFTDCVGWDGSSLTVVKLPSTSDQSDGVLAGAGRLVGQSRAGALLHGSTVATNAVLERSGGSVALVTDAGFEDVIEIGRQDRPSLYDSFADRATPLVPRSHRLGFDGDVDAVVRAVDRLGVEAVAVCLAYAFDDPAGEETLALALEARGSTVSTSHRVAPEFREFERTSTTVLNAYLGPVVGRYLRRLSAAAASVTDRIQMMRSSGGLIDLEEAADLPAALLLSGPAGGVVAAAQLGRHHRIGRVIAFDMGGTSTDVCRIERGTPEIAYERAVDGLVCRMPSVAVHTVGAGGGSIGWIDRGGSLRVGPHSAGANPGPASYGRGGREATVTDAHLHLGRIDPSSRLGGELSLVPDAGSVALSRLGESAGLDTGALAAGMLAVTDAHMERAVRAVSIEQGADPRDATLVAFGGAGGLHASGLAKRLGMRAVLVPPFAGVLSALGMVMAPPRLDLARSLRDPGPDGDGIEAVLSALAEEAVARFRLVHGVEPTRLDRVVDMRYQGQAHEVAVPLEPGEGRAEGTVRFHRLHADLNGFARPDDPVEVVTVRAVAVGEAMLAWGDLPRLRSGRLPARRARHVVFDGTSRPTSVWWRPHLPSGVMLEGPAVVEEETGTTVLEPGDIATVLEDGSLEVTW